MSTRLDALVALSRNAGATPAERALAAQRAARMIEAQGGNYLDTYPAGLPVPDSDARDWDDHVSDAVAAANMPALSPMHETYRSRTFGRRAFRNTLRAGSHR